MAAQRAGLTQALDLMMKSKGIKSLVLASLGIAAGFIGRRLLDYLMTLNPAWSHQIDTIGQGAIALAVVWFCLIPILELYGVIRKNQSQEV